MTTKSELPELYPLERAYHGELELEFGEVGEHYFEIHTQNPSGWDQGEYQKSFILTKGGKGKLKNELKSRAKSVYDSMVQIFEDDKVFWVLPSDHEAKIKIHGPGIGEIALSYTGLKVPIGDEKIEIKDDGSEVMVKEKYCNFWIYRKEKAFTNCHDCRHCGDGDCRVWEEIPTLSVDFSVRTMDQEKIDKVIEYLDNFILLDMYQNSPHGFKRYVKSLSEDEDGIERVLGTIVESGIENHELEEWLSKEYKELSEKSARRVMDD